MASLPHEQPLTAQLETVEHGPKAAYAVNLRVGLERANRKGENAIRWCARKPRQCHAAKLARPANKGTSRPYKNAPRDSIALVVVGCWDDSGPPINPVGSGGPANEHW